MPPQDLARSRPLLVTDDPQLLDEVLNLAGSDMEVAPDPAAARDRYGSAPIVLVGVDLADACARAHLPKRPGVIVVGSRRPGTDAPDPPWELAEQLGAEHIVLLPRAASWLADRLAVATGTGPTGLVLGVVGGRGGAGASVLATGLAVTAVRLGCRAMLVDGDPLGGGLDLMLGWEGSPGLRWPGLSHAAGGVGVAALDDALPRGGGSLPGGGELALLSCDRDDPAVPVEAMEAALDAGRRGWDLTVVDLPRRFDAAAETALAIADHVLLVVPAEIRACAAAVRVAAEALRHTGSLSAVVRTPAPARLSNREIARALQLSLAGSYRFEPAVARGLERGEPPAGMVGGSLSRLCERLLTDFGMGDRAVARNGAVAAAARNAAGTGGAAGLGGAA